jgi:hypothetical protein
MSEQDRRAFAKDILPWIIFTFRGGRVRQRAYFRPIPDGLKTVRHRTFTG